MIKFSVMWVMNVIMEGCPLYVGIFFIIMEGCPLYVGMSFNNYGGCPLYMGMSFIIMEGVFCMWV